VGVQESAPSMGCPAQLGGSAFSVEVLVLTTSAAALLRLCTGLRSSLYGRFLMNRISRFFKTRA